MNRNKYIRSILNEYKLEDDDNGASMKKILVQNYHGMNVYLTVNQILVFLADFIKKDHDIVVSILDRALSLLDVESVSSRLPLSLVAESNRKKVRSDFLIENVDDKNEKEPFFDSGLAYDAASSYIKELIPKHPEEAKKIKREYLNFFGLLNILLSERSEVTSGELFNLLFVHTPTQLSKAYLEMINADPNNKFSKKIKEVIVNYNRKLLEIKKEDYKGPWARIFHNYEFKYVLNFPEYRFYILLETGLCPRGIFSRPMNRGSNVQHGYVFKLCDKLDDTVIRQIVLDVRSKAQDAPVLTQRTIVEMQSRIATFILELMKAKEQEGYINSGRLSFIRDKLLIPSEKKSQYSKVSTQEIVDRLASSDHIGKAIRGISSIYPTPNTFIIPNIANSIEMREVIKKHFYPYLLHYLSMFSRINKQMTQDFGIASHENPLYLRNAPKGKSMSAVASSFLNYLYDESDNLSESMFPIYDRMKLLKEAPEVGDVKFIGNISDQEFRDAMRKNLNNFVSKLKSWIENNQVMAIKNMYDKLYSSRDVSEFSDNKSEFALFRDSQVEGSILNDEHLHKIKEILSRIKIEEHYVKDVKAPVSSNKLYDEYFISISSTNKRYFLVLQTSFIFKENRETGNIELYIKPKDLGSFRIYMLNANYEPVYFQIHRRSSDNKLVFQHFSKTKRVADSLNIEGDAKVVFNKLNEFFNKMLSDNLLIERIYAFISLWALYEIYDDRYNSGQAEVSAAIDAQKFAYLPQKHLSQAQHPDIQNIEELFETEDNFEMRKKNDKKSKKTKK